MLIPALTLLVMTALPAQAVYTDINKASPTQKLAYDWEGKDTAGQPISVTFTEFIFRRDPPGSPPLADIRLFTSAPPVVGANEYFVKDVARTVPLGTYKVNVRAQAIDGTFSAEGNDLFVRVIDEKKPDALKRLRVVGE